LTALPFDLTERVCVWLADDWPTWHGHTFAERYDRVGQPAAWDALQLLAMVLCPVVGSGKDGLPLWGPTVYGPPWREDGRMVCRRSSNTCSLSMVVLDVDDGTDVADLVEPGTFCVAHTSWSHTEQLPKWRVVYPLAAPVPAQDWAQTWRGIESKWPSVDPTTKDPSRMYYVPAVRQAAALCERSVASGLAYRRGTYEARVWLGDWLTLPPAPPPVQRVQLVRASGRVPFQMLSDDRRGRYGAAIARKRIELLATAGKGERNTRLFGAVVDCCRLAGADVVNWSGLEAELRRVAEGIGLKSGEVSQTIASAQRRADTLGAWDDWG